jgi:hypothetical protein
MMTASLVAPSGSAADYTGPFEKFVKEIQDGFHKAEAKYHEIVDNLNSWQIQLALIAMGGSGVALMWMIKNALENLLEGLRRLAKFVDEMLKHHTPIVSLMVTSFEWTNRIKGPNSNLSLDCTKPASDNLYNWTGAANSAYKDKAATMKAAVDEITARSEFISKWLFTVTKTNVEYVKKLAEIITFIVGKLVDAAAKAGSVIGLPLLGQTIGDAAGGLTEKSLNVLIQMGVNLVTALGDVRDVSGAIQDNTKLPNGSWPQVVRG